MLAAVYHDVGDIRVEEVPRPTVGDEEALLRVRAASLCGTDLRVYSSGHFKIPPGTSRILGHEFAGEVVEVGLMVKSLKPGMRVAIAPNIGCGVCEQCIQGRGHLCPTYDAFGITLDGAFSEYVLIPREAIEQGNVVHLPEGVSFDEAALIEPFSCCYNGSRACQIEPGDSVLIVGAGPIGIMHLFLASLSGASKIIISEMIEERLTGALEFGAELAVNPAKEDLPAAIEEATGGRGVDVIIIAAPSPVAQEQALGLAAPQGRINFFGGLPQGREFISFNSNRVHYRQLVVTGTTGSSNYQYRKSMEIVASRRVDLSSLISARFSLSEVTEALSLAASKQAMKVLITP
jgi:threonine dehydrogenase-like Zn-dependent dehydrogenase